MPDSTTPKTKPDSRFVDFDAAVDEVKPIPIRLLGQDWELPGSVPAEAILRVQKLMILAQQADDDELPDDVVVSEDLSIEKMARQLIGDDLLDEWLALGITYEQLTAVTQHVFALHSGMSATAGKAKGKKKPADRKRKASSSRPKAS